MTPETMTLKDKVRDALWRYSPDRAEKITTAAIVAGFAVASVATWLRKGKVQ